MFRNAEMAIRWAVDIKSKVIIDGSSINDMCGKPRPSSKNDLLRGLSPQEAHLQAEQILRHIENIGDDACKDYLLAKFCYSERFDSLMQRIFSRMLYSGGVHNRDVRKVVLMYLGAKISKREIRESLRCDRNKVNDLIDKIYGIIDSVHYQSLNDIENKFANSGLIERRSEAVA